MELMYIRLYRRLIVQSSFLAKWLGERFRVRVRARECPFFVLSFSKCGS